MGGADAPGARRGREGRDTVGPDRRAGRTGAALCRGRAQGAHRESPFRVLRARPGRSRALPRNSRGLGFLEDLDLLGVLEDHASSLSWRGSANLSTFQPFNFSTRQTGTDPVWQADPVWLGKKRSGPDGPPRERVDRGRLAANTTTQNHRQRAQTQQAHRRRLRNRHRLPSRIRILT